MILLVGAEEPLSSEVMQKLKAILSQRGNDHPILS